MSDHFCRAALLASMALPYVDRDDIDGARQVLQRLSLDQLRTLGGQLDRLSMLCFAMAGSSEFVTDGQGHPDLKGEISNVTPLDTDPGEREAASGRGWGDRLDSLDDSVLSDEKFVVDDLNDVPVADTSKRNL